MSLCIRSEVFLYYQHYRHVKTVAGIVGCWKKVSSLEQACWDKGKKTWSCVTVFRRREICRSCRNNKDLTLYLHIFLFFFLCFSVFPCFVSWKPMSFLKRMQSKVVINKFPSVQIPAAFPFRTFGFVPYFISIEREGYHSGHASCSYSGGSRFLKNWQDSSASIMTTLRAGRPGFDTR